MGNYDDYGDFVDWYDLAYESEENKPDIDFVVDLVRNGKNAEPHVLEMGSGSGRLLKVLAEAGITCAGVELSKKMIEKAKQRISREGDEKVRERISITEEDMATVKLNRKFDFVLFPYSVLYELESEEKVKQAVRNGYEHMKEDGMMVIDNGYYGQWKSSDDFVVKLRKTIESPDKDGTLISIFEARKRDQKTNETIIYLFIDKFGPGIPLSRIYFEIGNRFYIQPDKMKAILDEHKFQSVQAYKNYKFEPFEDSGVAGRQLWICKKGDCNGN
jgi:SAM-dependent methyltransferase